MINSFYRSLLEPPLHSSSIQSSYIVHVSEKASVPPPLYLSLSALVPSVRR